MPQKQNKEQEAQTRALSAVQTLSQILTALKQLDLGVQDVAKIEKVLKERGLIDLIIKKESKEAESLEDYLQRFWDYERSPYIAEKLSHGSRIGKAHARCCLERTKLYWVPHFKGKKIGEITKQNLKDFSVRIAKDYPLTA